MGSITWTVYFLLLSTHWALNCKFLRTIPVLEANSLQKFNTPVYIPSFTGITQDISVNLTKLFQDELSLSDADGTSTAIFFTDATESRPFVIRKAKDGSRLLKNELPLDREEVCNPHKFAHRVAAAKRCCGKVGADASSVDSRHDFKCCMFLGITVEGYGTFALRVDVIDVNDNRPQFSSPSGASLGRPGKEDLTLIKVTENTQQGNVIPLPHALDLDEGKNADLLFQVEKKNPEPAWEQHFKLLASHEDRCITKLIDGPQQKDITLPALCLLKTIDRETVSGFTFDLVARDQGEPVALSTTLSMSIMVSLYSLTFSSL